VVATCSVARGMKSCALGAPISTVREIAVRWNRRIEDTRSRKLDGVVDYPEGLNVKSRSVERVEARLGVLHVR
jgi:hypothetical protein